MWVWHNSAQWDSIQLEAFRKGYPSFSVREIERVGRQLPSPWLDAPDCIWCQEMQKQWCSLEGRWQESYHHLRTAEQKEEIHLSPWWHPWVTQLIKEPLSSKLLTFWDKFLIFQKPPLVRLSVACTFVDSLVFYTKGGSMCYECKLYEKFEMDISAFTYSLLPSFFPSSSLPHS